jgi:putative MFS transporter
MEAHGWQSLYFLGGGASLAVALGIAIFVRESAELDTSRRAPGAATATGAVADARLFVQLLGDPTMRTVTIMLWLMFLTVGASSFFAQQWTPSLLARDGYSVSQVAAAMAAFQICGAIGGGTAGIPIDRFGKRYLIALFLVGTPVLIALGAMFHLAWWSTVFLAISGFILLSLHLGLMSVTALVYPAEVRGAGLGIALASTRVGQLAGATLGGMVVAAGASTLAIYTLSAMLLLAGAGAAAALARTLATAREGHAA